MKTLTLALLFPALAVGNPCQWLGQKIAVSARNFATSAKNYAIEAKATRGGRIILKSAHPRPHEGRLFVPTEALRPNIFDSLSQWIPRKTSKLICGKAHDCKPRAALDFHLIDRPTRYVTKRLLGEAKDWTLPSYLIGGGFTTAFLWVPLWNTVNDAVLEHRIEEQLETQHERWKRTIDWDIRYSDIKEALQSGELMDEHAMKAAILRNATLKAYYENTLSADEAALELPTFGRALDWMANGVSLPPGFEKLPHFSETLDQKKYSALQLAAQRALGLQELASLWVWQPDKFNELTQDPDVLREWQKFISESHQQQLIGYRNRGTLSENELVFRLQESADWKLTFEEWNILGLSKKKKQNGVYLAAPLREADINAETIREIETSSL